MGRKRGHLSGSQEGSSEWVTRGFTAKIACKYSEATRLTVLLVGRLEGGWVLKRAGGPKKRLRTSVLPSFLFFSPGGVEERRGGQGSH